MPAVDSERGGRTEGERRKKRRGKGGEKEGRSVEEGEGGGDWERRRGRRREVVYVVWREEREYWRRERGEEWERGWNWIVWGFLLCC